MAMFFIHRVDSPMTQCLGFSSILRGIVVAVLVFTVGCSPNKTKWRGVGVGPSSELPTVEGSVAEEKWERLPWESWPLEQDLTGHDLLDAELLRGDQLMKAGRRVEALDVYARIDNKRLTVATQEALALRLASTQLALDQAARALGTISRHFRSRGLKEADVDQRFALVLGFAYGRKGDVDQSLAWFSRVNRGAGGYGVLHSAAKTGAGLLLRTQSEAKLSRFAQAWGDDGFVNTLIGEERLRRVRFGQSLAPIGRAFWDVTPDTGGVQQPGLGVSEARVTVLLPLSGTFAQLGTSSRHGIELAVQGGAKEVNLLLDVRDEGGTAESAREQLRQSLAAGGSSMILGPLLSDAATAVSEMAREIQIPHIAFAKNSVFPVGGGVFRLGATAESQAQSLLQVCSEELGMQRYALIAPADRTGEEYATALREAIAATCGTLVYDTTYQRGDAEAFVTIATEIEQHPVQGVFFVDSIEAAARFFGSLTPRYRQQIRPLGIGTWDNPSQLQRSRTVLEGAVFVSPFFAASKRDLVGQFRVAYKKQFASEPDFLAAQGFDAATLVVAALRRQVQEGVPFGRALQSIDEYQGLTGRLWVDETGEIQRRFAVVELQGGTVTEIGAEALSYVVHNNVRQSSSPADAPVESLPVQQPNEHLH